MSDSFATPWTIDHQAPLSMEFPRQDCWNELPFQLLLQGIFPTQGSNPCLLHWQADPLPLSHQGSPVCLSVIFIWASLVAQLVKNLPAIWETCIRSLGWEDPLEKGKATRSSILALRIPRTVFHGVPWGCKESETLSDFHFVFVALAISFLWSSFS